MADMPAQSFVTVFEDSRRWRHVERRSGDIIISTPPKSGTTLTQGIVTSLLWPAGDAPATRVALSPWVDARLTPIDDLVDRLGAMEHRRFLKTHSPGDCIPFDKKCRYIAVYRDGRDTLVSWANHRASMRPEVVQLINNVAAKAGVDPIPLEWHGDYDELFDEWQETGSPVRHLTPWWERRHAPNVLLVHYGDLRFDLEGEMRRIAEFLNIEIGEAEWPAVVKRCGLEEMRAAADRRGGLDGVFRNGAASFFNQGTNGRWQEVLSDEHQHRYVEMTKSLPEDAAIWLEHGSIAVGARPDEIGVSADESAAGSALTGHPVFGRLAKQHTNSLQAIAERRVADARDQGLFDNLALHGKPIPDIDRQRKPGWWANQFVAKERNKVRAMQLEEDLRRAKPALWRLPDEEAVVAEVARLNELIDDYNKRTTLAPMAALDLAETTVTWRRMQTQRSSGSRQGRSPIDHDQDEDEGISQE